MAMDRYTKTILTVIAACLVWLSVGGPSLVSSVSAQASGYERVILYGWVDQGGAERRFPMHFSTDANPEARNAPRALPTWQGN